MNRFQKIVLSFFLLMHIPPVLALKEEWNFSLFFPAFEGEGGENSEALSYHETGVVSLEALFFQDQRRWMLWLNGRPYSAAEPNEGLTIKNVTSDFADFEWVYQGHFHRFRLYPQQAYRAATRAIVERSQLMKSQENKEIPLPEVHLKEAGLHGARP